jgi:hypothetical protein
LVLVVAASPTATKAAASSHVAGMVNDFT